MAHTRQTSVSESLDKSGWAVLVACLAILKAGGALWGWIRDIRGGGCGGSWRM
jgi:hypothetical protein